MTRVYGAAPGGGAFSPENFFVTIGGMHAIEIATRLIVGPGDEALIPSPAWPNFVGALEISGARAVPARLDRTSRWSLDPAKLESLQDRRSMFDFLRPASKRARLWDAYISQYQSLRAEAQDNFQRFFGDVFREAYEAQARNPETAVNAAVNTAGPKAGSGKAKPQTPQRR